MIPPMVLLPLPIISSLSIVGEGSWDVPVMLLAMYVLAWIASRNA